MKHEKKYEILSGLDERLLEDALRNREEMMRPTVNRRTERFRRVVLLCACLTLLCASLVVMGVVGLSMVTGDRPGDTDAPSNTPLDVEWVEDPTIVQVQRLSVGKSFDTGNAPTKNDNMVTVDTEKRLGQRLILLRFHCREGEKITVTPSTDGALFEAVQIQSIQDMYWSVWNEQAEEYHLAMEYLDVDKPDNLAFLGESVVLTRDTVLMWQYPNIPRPCIEDNFVDFTVTDNEGNIKGGGSIYIGGLDLITVSENKTYYGGRTGYGDVYLNASYRPVLLGAYRYTEGSEVDTDTHVANLTALHDKASGARKGLFDDLSEDYFKLSYRAFLYSYEAEIAHGLLIAIIHTDISCDSYAYVATDHEKKLFFLYDGTCQPIMDWETYTADEYGRTVTGKLTLEDGTIVLVDINNPDCMYEIIPPTEQNI